MTRGMASYYPDRLHGRPTSTGETYDRAKFTAASKIFPYGTRLEVTNIVNGAKTQGPVRPILLLLRYLVLPALPQPPPINNPGTW